MEYNIMQVKFYKHYWFSETDIKYLIARLELPDFIVLGIKEMYNGYYLSLNKSYSYNPYSICKCLSYF